MPPTRTRRPTSKCDPTTLHSSFHYFFQDPAVLIIYTFGGSFRDCPFDVSLIDLQPLLLILDNLPLIAPTTNCTPPDRPARLTFSPQTAQQACCCHTVAHYELCSSFIVCVYLSLDKD